MEEGYIKLFRKFKKWEWYDDINTKVLFLHLLLSANHKDTKWQGIEIKKGQLITSIEQLSRDTELTVQQIRTSISKLKLTGELTSRATNKYTLLTLINWDKYQSLEEKATSKITSEATNEQQTNNKRATTNKNEKNENNIYNIYMAPQKKKKEKYGEYKNVLLSQDEYDKLKNEYDNYLDLIKYLDEYIEMKGYKAKSHYLCIKRWVLDAVNKNKNSKEPKWFNNQIQNDNLTDDEKKEFDELLKEYK